MNFQIAKNGRSFKGAFAYYLHDKDAQTGERVAWTATLNLASDDPAFAQSMMIWTAQEAENLKREAGVKSTGRKAAGPVHAYSIAWHPEGETVPDRAAMMELARESLKLLEADHLQAVVIAHSDTAHPHIHVVVNRVDPTTGKMHTFPNNAHKLDAWAAKYERDRNQIVSPKRDEKHEERKRRKRTQEPEPPKTASPMPSAAPAPPPASPAPPPPKAMTGEKSAGAVLMDKQDAMRKRHKDQWQQLADATKAGRTAIYAERIDFKAIAAQHRVETKPQWSELGKAQAAERRAFLDREKRVSGIVRNAIDTVRSQKIRGLAEDQGFLVMCFNYTLSSQARRAAFDGRQKEDKDQLAARSNATLMMKFDQAKAARGAKLDQVDATFAKTRTRLIEEQDKDKAGMRQAWRDHYAARQRAADLARHADQSRARVSRQTPDNYRHRRRIERNIPPPSPPPQEQAAVKAFFTRAAQLPVANLSPDPTHQIRVSVPTPAPSPSGMPAPSFA